LFIVGEEKNQQHNHATRENTDQKKFARFILCHGDFEVCF
jgi:hypothetical protein